VAEVLQQGEQQAVVVHTRPVIEMDDDQFFRFCQLNSDLQLERSAEGDIIIMAPAGGSSSAGNAALIYAFESWARVDRSGRVFLIPPAGSSSPTALRGRRTFRGSRANASKH